MVQSTPNSNLLNYSTPFYQSYTDHNNTSDGTYNSNVTDIIEENDNGIPMSRVLLCVFLFFIVIITIIGNIVVLLAFAVVKRLTKVRIILNIHCVV